MLEPDAEEGVQLPEGFVAAYWSDDDFSFPVWCDGLDLREDMILIMFNDAESFHIYG